MKEPDLPTVAEIVLDIYLNLEAQLLLPSVTHVCSIVTIPLLAEWLFVASQKAGLQKPVVSACMLRSAAPSTGLILK